MDPTSASTGLNESQIQMAVSFLKDDRVKSAPAARCVAFLKRKNLNKEEIKEAFRRVGRDLPDDTEVEKSEEQMKQAVASQSQLPSGTIAKDNLSGTQYQPPPVSAYAAAPAAIPQQVLMIPPGSQIHLVHPGMQSPDSKKQLVAAVKPQMERWKTWLLVSSGVFGGVVVLRELLKKYVVPLYFPDAVDSSSSSKAKKLQEEQFQKYVEKTEKVFAKELENKAKELAEIRADVKDLSRTVKLQQEYIDRLDRKSNNHDIYELKVAVQALGENLSQVLKALGSKKQREQEGPAVSTAMISGGSDEEFMQRMEQMETNMREILKWNKPIGSRGDEELAIPKPAEMQSFRTTFSETLASSKVPLEDFMSLEPAIIDPWKASDSQTAFPSVSEPIAAAENHHEESANENSVNQWTAQNETKSDVNGSESEVSKPVSFQTALEKIPTAQDGALPARVYTPGFIEKGKAPKNSPNSLPDRKPASSVSEAFVSSTTPPTSEMEHDGIAAGAPSPAVQEAKPFNTLPITASDDLLVGMPMVDAQPLEQFAALPESRSSSSIPELRQPTPSGPPAPPISAPAAPTVVEPFASSTVAKSKPSESLPMTHASRNSATSPAARAAFQKAMQAEAKMFLTKQQPGTNESK
eukprot:CAMPEP_0184695882 /NCGR_PEP_ID=MMETSP0313-20130426/3366_1 /TAXON_ID=2792 /ORGANISM="Porphyridium aerugineum, Strain SAG 1380-2" /LENGTH=636 /DNA_ID=CAMNT_0027154409 /DNA_START=51 /DNA_END=1961 /DNA_ORIENTATION=+